jgi:hypothetical protein
MRTLDSVLSELPADRRKTIEDDAVRMIAEIEHNRKEVREMVMSVARTSQALKRAGISESMVVTTQTGGVEIRRPLDALKLRRTISSAA